MTLIMILSIIEDLGYSFVHFLCISFTSIRIYFWVWYENRWLISNVYSSKNFHASISKGGVSEGVDQGVAQGIDQAKPHKDGVDCCGNAKSK